MIEVLKTFGTLLTVTKQPHSHPIYTYINVHLNYVMGVHDRGLWMRLNHRLAE